MTTTPTVLFVCLHGSAKSLIALESECAQSPYPARIPGIDHHTYPVEELPHDRSSA